MHVVWFVFGPLLLSIIRLPLRVYEYLAPRPPKRIKYRFGVRRTAHLWLQSAALLNAYECSCVISKYSLRKGFNSE